MSVEEASMSVQAKRHITPEEYLAAERKAFEKSEYFAGEVFAMAGTSREHGLIAANTLAYFVVQLRERPCETYGSDMRVKIFALEKYTHPDVVVVCGRPEFEDRELDTLLNPTAIVEVLSPSTETYDRGRKFLHCQKLPSVSDHILIAQDTHRIEHYARQPDNRWLLTVYDDPDDVVQLPSIGCALPLREAYAKVVFEPETSADSADGNPLRAQGSARRRNWR
jgi:Uma2 family endonuclease